MSLFNSIASIGPLWTTLTAVVLGGIACLLFGYFRKYCSLKARIKELEAENASINSQARQDERSNIASNLHDGVGAELSLLKMKLSRYSFYIKNNLRFKPESFMNDLQQLDSTIKSVRDVCHDLYDGQFRDKNLLESCHDFTQRLGDSGCIRCEFYSNLKENELNLTPEAKKTVFLVFLEIMNNIMRHAQCQDLHVALTRHEETLRLFFRHNGICFNNLDAHTRIAQKKGIGLNCINKRLQLLSGQVNYLSENNQQLVAVTIPERTSSRKRHRAPGTGRRKTRESRL